MTANMNESMTHWGQWVDLEKGLMLDTVGFHEGYPVNMGESVVVNMAIYDMNVNMTACDQVGPMRGIVTAVVCYGVGLYEWLTN